MASQKKQKRQEETMEELISSFIHHACELARNLESNLPNLVNHPGMLSMTIDEIVKAFTAAKEKLSFSQESQITSSSYAPLQMLPHEAFKQETQQAQNMDITSMQDQWLIRGGAYAVQSADRLIQMQQLQATARSYGELGFQQLRYSASSQIGEMGGRDQGEGSAERSKGSEGEVQAMEASPSRPRRRKDDAEKRTVTVPAPQYGNTDMPPEDGCTWRKYGQKEILGSKYPRSYYRCTHQKSYECPAKKQVQRLDQNPNMFAVTYRGRHTCYMSSTAPSSAPPQQLLVDISHSQDMTSMTQGTMSPQLSPSSTSASGWMPSMNLTLHGSSGMAPLARTEAGTGPTAGPSTSRYGTNTDYQLVAEMADAMFNSGSSSGNSMESLFPPAEEK